MRLYHFTTQRSKWLMTDGIGKVCNKYSSLNPGHGSEMCYSHTPRVVLENWQDFFRNPKRKWFCDNDTIPCMEDIELWEESGELGRLLYFIEERAGWFDGFALASFEKSSEDHIWVCEAEWLRKYHEGNLDAYSAHVRFAESRIPIEGYHGDFILPEYRVGNPIELARISWEKIPNYIKPTNFKTQPNHDILEVTLHF